LPEEADVLSAEVGGEVIKPARDSEEDGVLIPLYKSAVTNRQLATFPVEVLYMGPKAKTPSLFRALDLTAPATDIPVNEFRWEVLLPEKRRMYRATGDLKSADIPPAALPGAPRSTIARTTSGSRQETIYRLREGIERFYISDINNAAASAGGKGNKYEGPPITPPEGGAPRADVAVAGVLPVRIDLPLEGVAHHFRRIIVPENEALSLSLHTYPARLRVVLTMGRLTVWVLGIGAAALAARYLWRRVKVRVRKPSEQGA
jgi:hypothetical protein